MPFRLKNRSSSRRTFLKAVAGTFGATALPARVPQQQSSAAPLQFTQPTKEKRPNILYIHSHDTGRYTSPYGHRVPTPNLHHLAADGICFTEAYCAGPTCSPSRASLLTGQYPHSNGMLGLVNRGFTLNDFNCHIIHTLKREAGYTATLIGLQHIAMNSAMIGYDRVFETPGNYVEAVVPKAVEFLQKKPQEPFWLTVGFFETHRPFRQAGAEEDVAHVLPPSPISNVAETRADMADLHATLRKLDWGVGEVLRTLQESGLAENTLVISTTDHGIAFPNMKCHLNDSGLGVHLVMRGPGGFEGGRNCDALISQIDIFPTICELLEIGKPRWLQGRSFLNVIHNQASETNDVIFSELNYHASYEPMRAARTKRWKYIRNYSSQHPVLPNCDDGPTKTYWVKNGWQSHVRPTEELYDLLFDPNERNNLIADLQYAKAAAEMRNHLQSWMVRTDDPLLKGPLQPPHGASLNPTWQISPSEPTVKY